MRFAIISPACKLQEFATLSQTHLLLAHVRNPLYWRFYERLVEQRQDQMIIIDNSAYESQLSMNDAVAHLQAFRHITESRAILVLPDIRGGDAQDSFNLAANFLKQWRHDLTCDFMYVPQFNGTYDDYRVMLKYLQAMLTAFGIKHYGLPRIMAENGYSRPELCLTIKRQGEQWDDARPYVHALGMCAGSIQELEDLNEAQCDSIDSSAPVWRGWLGFDIEQGAAWRQQGTPCDFDVHPDTLTPDCHALILRNLRKVGVKC